MLYSARVGSSPVEATETYPEPTPDMIDKGTTKIFLELTLGRMLYVHYPGTTETEIKKIEEMRERNKNTYLCVVDYQNKNSPLQIFRKSAGQGMILNLLKVEHHVLFIKDLNALAKS